MSKREKKRLRKLILDKDYYSPEYKILIKKMRKNWSNR